MNEWVGRLPGSLVTDRTDLDAQFEAPLADSSALAFRVAYSVLRQRKTPMGVYWIQYRWTFR